MGMEIKVIFIWHENGLICRLEELSSLVGAFVENMVPSPWRLPCSIQLTSPAAFSSLSDKITTLGARWCGNLPSMSWLLSPFLEGFLSFTFNFVTNYEVKVTLYSWIKILVLRGIKILVLILTNVNIFIFKIKSKHSHLIKLTNEYNDRITKWSINYN